jgi:heat shock protein HslJ
MTHRANKEITMTKRLMLGLMVALAVLGLGGVLPAAAQGDALPAELLDKEWPLASLQRAPGDVVDTTGKGITLQFAADGSVSGSDGCNRFGGAYTVGAGGQMTITLGPSTLIACEQAISDLAQEYTQALGKVASYSTSAGSLQLSDSAGQAALTYTTGGPTTLPATGAGDELGGLLLTLAAALGLGLLGSSLLRRSRGLR